MLNGQALRPALMAACASCRSVGSSKAHCQAEAGTGFVNLPVLYVIKFKVDGLMSMETGNLTCRLSALMILVSLSWSSQALASGAEARRALNAGRSLLALELARPAAERGDSTAMLTLGMLYFRGEGVRQDYAAALKWWRAAAALGDIRAQNSIGILFRDGLGVERNYDEAIKWFELAAASGEAYAHRNLGLMYENGDGFAVDIKKALEFYKKSEERFRQALLNEPENYRNIDRMVWDLTHRIRWLSSKLGQPLPPVPMPITPRSGSGQQTPPR
jgi:tetratricopeptide (TPR) repeat protein